MRTVFGTVDKPELLFPVEMILQACNAVQDFCPVIATDTLVFEGAESHATGLGLVIGRAGDVYGLSGGSGLRSTSGSRLILFRLPKGPDKSF